MIDYAAILTRRYVGKLWILHGDAYTNLDWLSAEDKPSKETLDGLWESVQTEIAKEQADKQAVLTKLGITADEVKALLA
jgi:hypothetical protein